MSRLADNFEALDATEPYDVCVIGAGMTGSVLALRLTRAGLRVIVVDSGASARPSMPAEVAGNAGYRVRRGSGTSADAEAWDGYCERLEPADFRIHPYNRASNPWPIGYAELEPHYRAAEQLFRVREASGIGTRRLPQQPAKGADLALEALIKRHGVDAKAVRLATPARGRRFFSPRRELWPELLASRTGTLVFGVTATRLRTDRNGRVVGLTCRTIDGGTKTCRANAYVVATGALETPRLLLLSRSQRFPSGVGNDHERVGRGLNDHLILKAYGRVADGAGRAFAASTRALHSEQYHLAFRRAGLGAVHPFFARLGPLDALRRWPHGFARRSLRLLAPLREAVLEIVCRTEVKPADSNRVMLSGSSSDRFGDPRARIVFDYSGEDVELMSRTRMWLDRWLDRFGAHDSAHGEAEWAGNPIGTCRMGTDPKSSVCDATLRVHSSPNLYLCGTATLPRGVAVPPALTAAALAHRLADHLIARARWCARTPSRPQTPTAPRHVVTPIPLVRRPQR